MNLAQDKPIIPSPATPRPKADSEKAIETWEGEGGKVAPADDPRRGRSEPEGRSR
jgi:hypothetical protein